MDDVDLVRSRVDIVQLISDRVQLRRTGQNWTGLCPFHDDKNPSFTVSPKTGWYRCWSCGAKGDCFTWVMETQKLEFREALQHLATQVGVELKSQRPSVDSGERESRTRLMALAQTFFREAFAKSTQAQDYLRNRGLTPEIIDQWEIGYAPDANDVLAHRIKAQGFSLEMAKELFLVDAGAGGFYDKFRGRIMFPIRDERGQLVAFGGRLLADGHPKYINSSDTPLFSKRRVLYGLHQARDVIAKSRRAILVEGYLDVISCHRAGLSESVASLGTALGEDHARLLKRWADEVVVLYDADSAGQKAAARAAEILAAAGLRTAIAVLPPGSDPDTLLQQQGPAGLHQAVQNGMEPLDFEFRQLEARLAPDDREYWDEVVAILAQSHRPLEVERHIVRLAGKYPDLRDPIAAQRALHQLVRAAQKELRRKARPAAGSNSAESVPHPVAKGRIHLDAREAVVFRACLDEELRPVVWPRLSDDSLWITGIGARLAAAWASLGECPGGPAAGFLGHLDDVELTDEILALEEHTSLPVTLPTLQEALDGLERRREQRAVVELRTQGDRSDATLDEISARLKRLKNIDSSPES